LVVGGWGGGGFCAFWWWGVGVGGGGGVCVGVFGFGYGGGGGVVLVVGSSSVRVQSAFALSHFVSQSRFVSGLTKMKTSCPQIEGKRTEVTVSESVQKGCGENYLQI